MSLSTSIGTVVKSQACDYYVIYDIIVSTTDYGQQVALCLAPSYYSNSKIYVWGFAANLEPIPLYDQNRHDEVRQNFPQKRLVSGSWVIKAQWIEAEEK